MKTTTTRMKLLLLTVFLCCMGMKGIAQQTFNCWIADDHMISPTQYEFDVYMQGTGTDFYFRSIQFGIQFNSAFIPAGATITPTSDGTVTQLLTGYSAGSPQWVVASNVMNVPSSSAGTCSGAPSAATHQTFGLSLPAKRVVRFRLTSSIPFNCAPPNPTMVPPLGTAPSGALRMAVSSWGPTCLAVSLNNNGSYTNFTTNSQTANVNNLHEMTVGAPSPSLSQLCAGTGTTSFTVNATGNGTATPLSYVWMLDGNPLSDNAIFQGTQTSTLTVTNPSAGGLLTCQVSQCSPTNPILTSSPATLTVVQSDDNNACTIDVCDPATGNVTHSPVNTDDNNVCTTDGCDPATGVFHNAVNTDDNNPCTADGCDPVSGVFHNAIDFSDANVCDIESCDPSTGNISHTPVNVNDNNACTIDGCDPATGPFHTAVNPNDNNACTADACDPATGIHNTPIDVNDNNACTADGCDPASGPTHTTINPNDNNACTIDYCDAVTGVHNDPISVNDNNACTADGCDPVSGPFHNPVNTNDNNACTADGCDPVSGVFHNPVNTNDNNVCTTDGCDPVSGVFHNPVNTDDNNPCTADGCDPVSGVFHNAIDFSDANVCDIESCDPATGNISHTAVNVNDNNACTADGCDPVSGPFHTPVNANDNNACTFDYCDPATGVHNDAINVNDNNACTIDGCDPVSGPSHIAVNSNDNNACTFDYCDAATGVHNDPINVNDNNACTADGCDPVTGPFHNAVNTDDNNACTTDGCDPVSGVFHNPVNTNDNNVCTTDGCDPVTGVFHNPVNTDDNNPCTADGCDPVSGVFHNAIDFSDANVCDIESCDPATGNISHTPVSVNDNNACTADGCDPVSGPFHTPVNPNDNNACTFDYCDAVTGVHNDAINVNDNNACTIDGCDPVSGPTHTAVDPNDNNACTADACDPVTGVHNTPVNVNDNNACTIDGCDPVSGTFHNPVNADDNNMCTSDFCDPVTGVHNVPLPGIDDNNVCTTDGCDPATGIISHNNISVDDNNACTIDGCNPVSGPFHTAINTDDGDPCTVDACDPALGNISHTANNVTVTPVPGTIACHNGSTCVTVTALGGVTPYQSGTGIFCAVTAGTWTYTVVDAVGCAGSQTIVINDPPKITIDVLTSTPTGCSGNTGTAHAEASGGTGLLSYHWSNGQNGQDATGLAATTYTVTVTDANGCTTASSVVITNGGGGTPPAPDPISGSILVCKGQCGLVYSVPPVAGATSYTWTLPNGLTGSSTSNTITICVTSRFKGGFICVRANSGLCGSGPSTCLNVVKVKDKPVTPSAIFGPTFVCSNTNATFSIAAVPFASSYVWTVTNGMTIINGQGTTSVLVHAPAGFTGGTVKVYARNCKGNSGTRNKSVTNGIPGNPGSITGPASVCKSRTYNYSCGAASNALSYTWAVTGGAQIISGQGTRNVSIKYQTATQTTAVVSVVANGACAVSAPKTRNVSVNLACRTAADGVSGIAGLPVSDLNAYPNPTSGKATVSFNVASDTRCMLRVMDMLGNVLVSETIAAVEGLNTKDINLATMAKGVYFISIQTEANETQTLRIVVE